MKKLAIDATVEELIQDVSYYEDPDQMLIIAHDGKGEFIVADQEWRRVGTGKSLKDALIAYGKLYRKDRHPDDDKDKLYYE